MPSQIRLTTYFADVKNFATRGTVVVQLFLADIHSNFSRDLQVRQVFLCEARCVLTYEGSVQIELVVYVT